MIRHLNAKLLDYCEQNSSLPDQLLQALERETYLKTLSPNMISGSLQGRFLSLISKLIQPQRILEIGTFTAYATLCMAEGLSKNGRIIGIEINNELEFLIRKYVDQSRFSERIEIIFGDALDILPSLEEIFDLVFIDAAKIDYLQYYEIVFPKLRQGGIIIADNVLWSGKVVEKAQDDETRKIQEFNHHVSHDSRVECLLLPFRDGLMILRKK